MIKLRLFNPKKSLDLNRLQKKSKIQMMLKEQLFSNWYPIRWFMLIIGVVLGINYLTSGSAISGLLSLVILFQAVTNTGCLLGHSTPAADHQTKNDLNLDDVTFEEIKTD